MRLRGGRGIRRRLPGVGSLSPHNLDPQRGRHGGIRADPRSCMVLAIERPRQHPLGAPHGWGRTTNGTGSPSTTPRWRRGCERCSGVAPGRRQGPLRVGEIVVDTARREVRVAGRPVKLANKEFVAVPAALRGYSRFSPL
jgi:hypothetical protein